MPSRTSRPHFIWIFPASITFPDQLATHLHRSGYKIDGFGRLFWALPTPIFSRRTNSIYGRIARACRITPHVYDAIQRYTGPPRCISGSLARNAAVDAAITSFLSPGIDDRPATIPPRS